MQLNELRKEIDAIDKEMCHLFEKRMNVVKKIGEYKKLHNLPVLDETREKEVIEKNSSYLLDQSLLSYYQEFLTMLMTLSKKLEK